MEQDKMYIISVYSENQVGLLSSITSIFTRRNVNIESMTAFPSEFPGVHHMVFRATTNRKMADTLVKMIEKKVDVLRAFAYECNDVERGEHGQVAEFLQKYNKTI